MYVGIHVFKVRVTFDHSEPKSECTAKILVKTPILKLKQCLSDESCVIPCRQMHGRA